MAQGKRILKNFQIATNGDLSANFTSTPTYVQTFDRFLLSVVITGAPTGTLTIEESPDYMPSVSGSLPASNSGTWNVIPFTLNPVAGAPESYNIDFTETGLVAIRVRYAATGGAGTINAYIAAKES